MVICQSVELRPDRQSDLRDVTGIGRRRRDLHSIIFKRQKSGPVSWCRLQQIPFLPRPSGMVEARGAIFSSSRLQSLLRCIHNQLRRQVELPLVLVGEDSEVIPALPPQGDGTVPHSGHDGPCERHTLSLDWRKSSIRCLVRQFGCHLDHNPPAGWQFIPFPK
jgi:hypothetical protein